MNRRNRGHVRVFEAVDSTAPGFQSAATNAAGNKIILTYDEALSATAASSAFTVQTAGTNNRVTAVAISGSKVRSLSQIPLKVMMPSFAMTTQPRQ